MGCAWVPLEQVSSLLAVKRCQPRNEHCQKERARDGLQRREHPRNIGHRDDVTVANSAERDKTEVKGVAASQLMAGRRSKSAGKGVGNRPGHQFIRLAGFRERPRAGRDFALP